MGHLGKIHAAGFCYVTVGCCCYVWICCLDHLFADGVSHTAQPVCSAFPVQFDVPILDSHGGGWSFRAA